MRLARLAWVAALVSCAGALIIPDQLVSLLTVVYSVIPPVKKGSDSRIGFGYRFGPFADFQVLLELGPQTETQPIGGQAAAGAAGGSKRDADPAKTPAIQVLDDVPSEGARASRSHSLTEAPEDSAPQPQAQAPAPAPAAPDWLSRWRSSLSSPQGAERASRRVETSPRRPPPRPPRPARRAPAAAPAAAPASSSMSPEARWEAMRRLRSLHWAGQQG